MLYGLLRRRVIRASGIVSSLAAREVRGGLNQAKVVDIGLVDGDPIHVYNYSTLVILYYHFPLTALIPELRIRTITTALYEDDMVAFCSSSTFLRPSSFRPRVCSRKAKPRRYVETPKMLGPRLDSPVVNSEAAEKTAKFEEWLIENGMYLSKLATWGKPKHPLAVANETTDEGEPSGRGLIAVKPITQGESLFNVPVELILSQQRAVQEIPQLPSDIDDYLAIATLLMRERGRGENSFWKPYLDVLPADEEIVPLFRWTEEDLEVLKGSPSLAAARNLRMKLEKEFKEMELKIFSKHRELFPEDSFNYHRWEWAFAVLFSRAIMLTNAGYVALVPYADLLNHNPFVSTFIDLEGKLFSDDKFVTLYTDRPYPQMAQVYVTYGPKPNSELLLLYGFVVDRNPYDSVDITVSLNEDDPLWERKRQYLAESGVKPTSSFPLYRDRYPMELVEFLRFCVATEEELDTADFGEFVSTENENQVANALIEACRSALETYPTTIEEDETLIKDRPLYMMLEQKRRWAIRLRVSEKRILRRTMLNIEQEMTDPSFLFTPGK